MFNKRSSNTLNYLSKKLFMTLNSFVKSGICFEQWSTDIPINNINNVLCIKNTIRYSTKSNYYNSKLFSKILPSCWSILMERNIFNIADFKITSPFLPFYLLYHSHHHYSLLFLVIRCFFVRNNLIFSMSTLSRLNYFFQSVHC